MCTALTFATRDFYFGRTLDNDFSYGEEVVITPRNFTLAFRKADTVTGHFAIIGTALVNDDYPLYYDAVNEKGLCMAGLNFVGNAVYSKPVDGRDNIAQFELVPWILSQCESIEQVKSLLGKINIIDEAFSTRLPPAQLHWIVADKRQVITVEATAEGLKIYDNPVGVLTNNPPFGYQLFALNNFMSLSAKPPENTFSDKLNLSAYSRGMGAIGLPGDLSSQSRFIRAVFVKMNSVCGEGEDESVGQFFHVLGSVEQQRGCCVLENGKQEITVYTSCCNADKGIYYYTTYSNRQITAVDMHRENLEACELIRCPFTAKEQICRAN